MFYASKHVVVVFQPYIASAALEGAVGLGNLSFADQLTLQILLRFSTHHLT